MLEDHFKYIGVSDRVNYRYIQDEMLDHVWSKNLDELIVRYRQFMGQASIETVLYGSRDSFIPHYTGDFKTEILEPKIVRQNPSGTAVRESIAENPQATAEFRAGAVWSAYHRYPTTFTTVDVAVFNESGLLVLGRKKNEELWRFPGGFSEPNSPSFEDDAKREVREETGLILSHVEYIGSMLIDDWRYRKEVDKIKTLFFIGRNPKGRMEPGDDLFELKTIELTKWPNYSDLVPNHRPLMEMLSRHLMWKDPVV
jgi:bifunctional NMN adenylyltransferase/nudix hydrolase